MFYVTWKKQPSAVSLKIMDNFLETPFGGYISCKLVNLQPLRIGLQRRRFPSTLLKFNVIISVQFEMTDIYDILIFMVFYINPLLASAYILYPLKAPENVWFPGVLRGVIMKTLARNGLRNIPNLIQLKIISVINVH